MLTTVTTHARTHARTHAPVAPSPRASGRACARAADEPLALQPFPPSGRRGCRTAPKREHPLTESIEELRVRQVHSFGHRGLRARPSASGASSSPSGGLQRRSRTQVPVESGPTRYPTRHGIPCGPPAHVPQTSAVLRAARARGRAIGGRACVRVREGGVVAALVGSARRWEEDMPVAQRNVRLELGVLLMPGRNATPSPCERTSTLRESLLFVAHVEGQAVIERSPVAAVQCSAVQTDHSLTVGPQCALSASSWQRTAQLPTAVADCDGSLTRARRGEQWDMSQDAVLHCNMLCCGAT